MRPIHGNPGLCRGQTAYSGNGEPGYPKWPGAVAILVPFVVVVVVVVVVVLVVVVTVVIVVVVVAAFNFLLAVC